jgi:hypothetical protein
MVEKIDPYEGFADCDQLIGDSEITWRTRLVNEVKG